MTEYLLTMKKKTMNEDVLIIVLTKACSVCYLALFLYMILFFPIMTSQGCLLEVKIMGHGLIDVTPTLLVSHLH